MEIAQVSQAPVTAKPVATNVTTPAIAPEAVQTKPNEIAPETKAPEVKVEDKLTPRFAELTKRERGLTQRERDIKLREDQLKTSVDPTKSPKKFLEEKKFTLEQFITNYLAEDAGKPVVQGALDPKVAEVLEKVTNWEKKQQEQEEATKAQQAESNLKAYKASLDTELKSKSEYKYINAFTSDSPETADLTGTELVYSIMNAKYQSSNGEVQMTTKEAADIAEKYLAGVVSRLQASEPKVESKQEIKSSPTLTGAMAPSGFKETMPYLPRDESIKVLAQQWKEMNLGKK